MKIFKDSHPTFPDRDPHRKQYGKLADVTTQHGLKNQPTTDISNTESLKWAEF